MTTVISVLVNAVLIISLLCGCFGETITWSAGSGNFSNAANWSPKRLPKEIDDVVILSGKKRFLY
jgi:hypothetical protein